MKRRPKKPIKEWFEAGGTIETLEGFTQKWGIKLIVWESRIWWSLSVRQRFLFHVAATDSHFPVSRLRNGTFRSPRSSPSGRLGALITGVKCVCPLILSCARLADRYTPFTPVFLSHLSLSFFYQPLPFFTMHQSGSSYPHYCRPGPKMRPVRILPVVAPVSLQFSAVCTQPGSLVWFCPRHPLS